MPTTCKRCGATFEARRSTARFCSANCRVSFNREALRQEVRRVDGDRCCFAPIEPSEPNDNFEEVNLHEDLGPCGGKLLVLRKAKMLVCRRHKGVLGERAFASKYDSETYRAIRHRQGLEKIGNFYFARRVKGFMKGYRNPDKLGPKSTWENKLGASGLPREVRDLDDARAYWDGGESF